MADHPDGAFDDLRLRAAAFDALPSQAAVLDADGVIRATNAAWQDFGVENGVAGPDMVGVDYLAVCDPGAEGACDAAEGISAVIDGDSERFELEYPCHSPDEKRWFRMAAIPMPDGEQGGALVVHSDITERRLAEESVAERNELLQAVTSILSHDLRNPLTVALGRAGVLADQVDDPTHAEAVLSSLERMETIVEDALTLARESAVEDPETVELGDAVRTAWKHVATGDATLDVPADGEVLADRSLLVQLFENLVRNAVEHGSTSPPSHAREDAVEHAGSDVAVTVGLRDEGDGFYVADDGPGIDPADVEGVFDAGYTTSTEGTGFGLAIVERIATVHGWTVSVGESAGGGARFDVTGVERP